MKCFTWGQAHHKGSKGVFEGVEVRELPRPENRDAKTLAVSVGEEGRGRKLDTVFVDSVEVRAEGEGSLYNRKIIRRAVPTRRGQTRLLKDEETDAHRADRRALVKLSVEGGYRGGVDYDAADFDVVPCRHVGSSMWRDFSAVGDGIWTCDRCGSRVAATPTRHDDLGRPISHRYDHALEGKERKYKAFPPPGVTIVAQGQCAQGDAGRMGAWGEYLVIMEPGTTVRICRYGRLYGAPAVSYLTWTGEEMVLGVKNPVDVEKDAFAEEVEL